MIKGDDKKPYQVCTDKILSKPVYRALAVLVLVSILVISLSIKHYATEGFGTSLLVEAHGMLFDILVIGIFIMLLNLLAEKRAVNQRYREEIDDFRGWLSPEAAHRIAGNIRRLNRNGKWCINLSRCHLENMDLKDVNLVGSNLQKASLNEAILQNADFKDAIISDAYFEGAMLEGAIFRGAGYRNIKFVGARLMSADLRGAILNGSYFQEANLRNAKLNGAHLNNSGFQKSLLQYANFKDANLDAANFQNARLKGVNFQNTWLAYADFRGAEDLNIKQLVEASTLYEAKLDYDLLKQIEEKYPHLLEEPK